MPNSGIEASPLKAVGLDHQIKLGVCIGCLASGKPDERLLERGKFIVLYFKLRMLETCLQDRSQTVDVKVSHHDIFNLGIRWR